MDDPFAEAHVEAPEKRGILPSDITRGMGNVALMGWFAYIDVSGHIAGTEIVNNPLVRLAATAGIVALSFGLKERYDATQQPLPPETRQPIDSSGSAG